MSVNSLIAAGGWSPIDFVDRYQRGQTNALNAQTMKSNLAGAPTTQKINDLNLRVGEQNLADHTTNQNKKRKAEAYFPILAAAVKQKSAAEAKAVLQQHLTPIATDPQDRADLQNLLAMDDATFGPSVGALYQKVTATLGIKLPDQKDSGFTLGKDQQRYDANGQLVASGPASHDKPKVVGHKPGDVLYDDAGNMIGTVPGGDGGDVKPPEQRAIYNDMGKTIAKAFGADGLWDPVTGDFVMKDTKSAAKATAIQRKAIEILRDEYKNDYKSWPDATFKALELFGIKLPDTPTPAGATPPPTTRDWLENKFGPR